MAKVLVTGGAGYIGAHTVHYMLTNGVPAEEIIVLDNLIYGHRDFLPDGVTFIEGDLLDKSAVDTVFQDRAIDRVIHFAAYAYVGESMEQPGKYFENNITGGLNLLEAMIAHDCRKLVFSSTCATYGVPDSLPITETTPQRPVNPYGQSKLMFEQILQWYATIHHLSSVSLRYFNAAGAAYGIGEAHEPESHLIPLALQAALGERESVAIYGTDYNTPDGTCIRDYIHVLDLAAAHVKALEHLNDRDSLAEQFNLGTGKGVSVQELITTAREITGKSIVAVTAPRRSGDPAALVADPSKAQAVLGWKAEHDITSIIADAWAWHEKRHHERAGHGL